MSVATELFFHRLTFTFCSLLYNHGDYKQQKKFFFFTVQKVSVFDAHVQLL